MDTNLYGLSREIADTMGSVLLSVPVLLIMWYDGHVSVIEYAFLDLEFPTKSEKLLRCRVVNVYGPHKKFAENNQQLLIDFYGQVRDALTVPANIETFVLGDFNSKLGKMTTSDMDFGFGRFMGKFGMGSRNEMGENLLDFLSEFNLFATNTGFCHPARHTITYTGWRKDWSAGRNSR